MYTLISFICGLIFGLGLTISNMINPNKVLNFLDVAGAWDPTLLVVMVAALFVTVIGYQWIGALKKPRFSERFFIPEKKLIDSQLIAGSILFGVGWGLAGYCPGPGISALATFNTDPLYFVLGLLLGSFSYYFFKNR